MTTRIEQKKRTRQKLVNAALQLSAQSGFSGLSLREVTREAGIAPTSFYRHFQDMDALGLALVDEVGNTLRQLLREARHNLRPNRSAVRTSMETLLQFLREQGHLFRILLGERMGSSPAFRVAINTELAVFVDELADDLHRESTRKQRPLSEVKALAEAMVTIAFHNGGSILDAAPHEQEEILEKLITQLRMVLRGSEAIAANWAPK